MPISWDDIPDEGTSQYDQDYPLVSTDLYEGVIVHVGDVYDTTSTYQGQTRDVTKFTMNWEIRGGDLIEPIVIKDWVTFPAQYLMPGRHISSLSQLHKLMTALGFDMKAQKITVRPLEWVGLTARVDVELKDRDDGTQRSFVQGYRPSRQRPPAAAPARGRRPVASAPRGQPAGWDEDDEG